MSPSLRPASAPAPWLYGCALLLAVAATYQNSLFGPFVFDDLPSIVDNPSIRQAWPPGPALSPPSGNGLTVEGRPLLNYSFALNYALSGLAPWSYHLVNLAIHAAASLTLFGLARRLLARRAPAPAATPAAFAIALLWAVHPLTTAAVTYIVQRAESLMALFCLLTLYAFTRAAGTENPANPSSSGNPSASAAASASAPFSPTPSATPSRTAPVWLAVSVAACALGMATKEVMAGAPLLVFACDRVFFAGDWRAAWQLRRPYYLALAATWLILAAVLFGMEATRGGTAGLGTAIPWWHYAATQCAALPHYLRLCLWPAPLIFDYGTALVPRPLAVWPQALLLFALLAATFTGLRRGSAAGWLGLAFFVLLAPSSSIVPIATQTLAEHRLYLPLAAVLGGLVSTLVLATGRAALPLVLATALALSLATRARNHDYSSAVALHTHTVRHHPANARAHHNLGIALADQGRLADAILRHREAVRLDPSLADAHNHLGNLLLRTATPAEARAAYAAALLADPDHPGAHFNLARLDLASGDPAAAALHFRAVLRRAPDDAPARNGLGAALLRTGDPAAAAAEFTRALRLDPSLADAHNNLGALRLDQGDPTAASACFAAALRADPDHPDARSNLGLALLSRGDLPAAIHHLEVHLARHPTDATAHLRLAVALANADRLEAAIVHTETALRLRPEDPAARENLAILRARRAALAAPEP